jgi:hypothetical protein
MSDDDAPARLFYPSTVLNPTTGLARLCCTFCGKTVSSEFRPMPNEITPVVPDLIVRAVITCPECIEEGALLLRPRH